MSIKFNVAALSLCTEAEGPFRRMSIWFQGCDMDCKGCCNPDLRHIKPSHIMQLDALIALAQKSMQELDIEGVTYLGGEPTLQKSLPLLTSALSLIGLGVICFTGRNYLDVKELVKGVDMVIDGQYEKDLPDTRRIIGSTNQRLIHQTDRYKKHEDWFYRCVEEYGEFNLSDASIVYNGNVL